MGRLGAAKRRMLSLAERPVLGAREPLAPLEPEGAAGIVMFVVPDEVMWCCVEEG